MASEANIRTRIRDLAKKELFRKVKTYRPSVSEERKRKNKSLDAIVKGFFITNLPVKINDKLWKDIQKITTEALRSKRSSVTEAIKKIFTGKDVTLLNCLWLTR